MTTTGARSPSQLAPLLEANHRAALHRARIARLRSLTAGDDLEHRLAWIAERGLVDRRPLTSAERAQIRALTEGVQTRTVGWIAWVR